MTMKFTQNETVALYVFGCGDLERTTGNIFGAYSLCKDRQVKKILRKLCEKLAHPDYYQKDYENTFYQVKMEVSADLKERNLIYQKVTEDVSNDFPWKNYLQVLAFNAFCDKHSWDSMNRVRMLMAYIVDPTIKEVVSKLYDKLFCIVSLNEWDYELYRIKYETIGSAAKNLLKEYGEASFLQYVWEVPDVELE